MSYASTVLADSPIAYWRLGEPSGTTATSQTGVHNGTYVNTPTLAVAGAIGQGDADTAVTFAAASSQRVLATTLGTLGAGLGSSSWEFWIKTTTALQQAVFGVLNTGTATLVQCLLNTDNLSALSVGKTHFSIRDESGGEGVNLHITNNIYDGQWHHVVFVVTDPSRNLMVAYVDGQIAPVSLSPAGGGSPSNFANLGFAMTIGARNNRGTIDLFASATIDEVACYPSRLSAAQVVAHWVASTGQQPKLQTTSGIRITDIAGGRPFPTPYDPVSPELSWQPPDLSDYVDLHVNNANRSPTLNNTTKYRVIFDEPITAGPLTFTNGGGIFIRGGEVDFRGQPALRDANAMRAFFFNNVRGNIFCEGVWIRGSAPEPKNCTGNSTTDVITATGHTFQNNEQVVFHSITGGAGLVTGNPYYVINRATDTLQLSTSSGGAAINFTTDITAGVLHRASGSLGDGFQLNSLTDYWYAPHLTLQNIRFDSVARVDCKAQEDGTGVYAALAVHSDLLQIYGTSTRNLVRIDKMSGDYGYQGIFMQSGNGHAMDWRRMDIDGEFMKFDGVNSASAYGISSSSYLTLPARRTLQDVYIKRSNIRSMNVTLGPLPADWPGVIDGVPPNGSYVPAGGGVGQPGMNYISPGYQRVP
jgi:hypothetical protein